MMKKFAVAVLSVLLSMLFVLGACSKKTDDEEEYTLERAEGTRQVTIYYNREEGYEDCDVWFWYGSVDGRGYEFHKCAYGAKFVINVPDTVEEVSYIIRTGCSDPGGTSWGTANKDGTDSDRKIKLTGDYTVIYTKAKDKNNYISNDGGKTLEIIKFISIADMQDSTHVKVALSDGSSVSKDDVSIKDAGGNAVAVSGVSGNIVTTSSALDLSVAYTLYVKGIDTAGHNT